MLMFCSNAYTCGTTLDTMDARFEPKTPIQKGHHLTAAQWIPGAHIQRTGLSCPRWVPNLYIETPGLSAKKGPSQ